MSLKGCLLWFGGLVLLLKWLSLYCINWLYVWRWESEPLGLSASFLLQKLLGIVEESMSLSTSRNKNSYTETFNISWWSGNQWCSAPFPHSALEKWEPGLTFWHLIHKWLITFRDFHLLLRYDLIQNTRGGMGRIWISRIFIFLLY